MHFYSSRFGISRLLLFCSFSYISFSLCIMFFFYLFFLCAPSLSSSFLRSISLVLLILSLLLFSSFCQICPPCLLVCPPRFLVCPECRGVSALFSALSRLPRFVRLVSAVSRLSRFVHLVNYVSNLPLFVHLVHGCCHFPLVQHFLALASCVIIFLVCVPFVYVRLAFAVCLGCFMCIAVCLFVVILLELLLGQSLVALFI